MINIYDEIEKVKIEKLKSKSVMDHKDSQLYKIKLSIKKFGFIKPIIINKEYEIIAGNLVYQASKQLNLKEVPCIITDLNKKQSKAYRIMDNESHDLKYNLPKLTEELKELKSKEYPTYHTGLENMQIDILIKDKIDINKFYEVDESNSNKKEISLI